MSPDLVSCSQLICLYYQNGRLSISAISVLCLRPAVLDTQQASLCLGAYLSSPHAGGD